MLIKPETKERWDIERWAHRLEQQKRPRRSLMKRKAAKTGWKKKRAAEILGINPSTLYRKLQRYGMDTGEEE